MNNTGSFFNIIYLTATWYSNSEIINSSYFDINSYKAIPFERKTNKRGGFSLIYLKADLIHKIKKDLSIYDKDKEILTIEIITNESKNMLLSCCYRSPKAIKETLTAYLTSIFQGVPNEKKKSFIIGNFNLNCLNYNEDNNIKHFYHKVFELGFFPLIGKPSRVCKSSATLINNILTNGFFLYFRSGHFPIIFSIQTAKNQSKCQTLVYNKRDFNKANKAAFQQQLSIHRWRHLISQKDVNKVNETLLSTFLEIYETNFRYKQVTVKPIDIKSLR